MQVRFADTLIILSSFGISACADLQVTAPETRNATASVIGAPASVQVSVTVCHVDQGNPGYKLISVSTASAASHIAHGDALPGGPLGEDCKFVAVFLDPRTTYETQLFGGGGGYPFADDCPAGSVGTGLSGSVATWYGWGTVALLQLHCRALLPDGTLGIAMGPTTPRGGGGAATFLQAFIADCSDGQTLVGVSGVHSSYMNSIAGMCATIPTVTAGAGGVDSAIGPFLGIGDFGSNTAFDKPCRAGYVITGLIGRSGDIIDAIGFRCTQIRTP
jgi:hypothetical protein